MGGGASLAGANIHRRAEVLVSVQQYRERERGHYRERICWSDSKADSLTRGKATTKRLRGTYP